jgi:tetratricopeptide (TPR) repeat protein
MRTSPFLGILLIVAGGGFQTDATELEFWGDPEFKKRFSESYLAETEVEPRTSDSERATLLKVVDLMGAEKIDEATAMLEKEIARNPDGSAVFDFTLANLYFQNEKLEPALPFYRIAVQKFPKFRRAWKNLALLHVRRGEFEEALPALTRVVEQGGQDAVTYGLLGYAYSSTEDPLSAETAYRMAILLDPKTTDWRMGLARSLFKQERYEEAVTLCTRLIEEHPDRADLWLLQANAYLGMNQTMKAAEIYELVDHLGKSTPESLFTLGDIYLNSELNEMAVEASIRALELAPGGDGRRALRAAKVLTTKGALEESRRLIDRIEELAGENLVEEDRMDVLKLRARRAVADGSGEEEVRTLEEIVAIDPLDGGALILLGQHSARIGDEEKAAFYYERASSIEKYEADARVRHAQLLVRKGKYAEALPLLRRAQLLQPRDNVQEFLEQVERVAKGR